MLATIARASSLILAAVFAWACGAKVLGWPSWRTALQGYKLGVLVGVASWAVPLLEGLAAVLLWRDNVRLGAALVLCLVSGFSLAVLRARALAGDRVPCGCFGRADARDYREMLARNLLLGCLAAVVLVLSETPRDIGAVSPVRALPVLLAIAGLGLLAWVVRQTKGSLRRRESER